MKITVRGKNIEVTPALVGYAEKKLGKLAKFFEGKAEAQVVLSVIRDDHIVEVTVFFNGLILRSEEKTGDMYASLDMVVDKLEKQVARYKTRLIRTLRRQDLRIKAERLTVPAGSPSEGDTNKVVKTKRFAIKPMPLDEAILQMNLLGHNFFVFANSESNQVNVLYRRKDGNYGLIEPEL